MDREIELMRLEQSYFFEYLFQLELIGSAGYSVDTAAEAARNIIVALGEKAYSEHLASRSCSCDTERED